MRALAIALACCIATTTVAAQPATTDVRAARKHFEAGKKLMQKQRFDEAIRELETAFQLDPRGDQIYNLGVAHHLSGNDAVAIEYYRLFLLDAPTGKAAKDAAGYLTNLEGKAAEARAEKQRRVITDAQSRAIDGTSAETVRYQTIMADVDISEQKLAVLDAQLKAAEAERAEAANRAAAHRKETQRVTGLALRWERRARMAPSGDGRGRRLFGTFLVGASLGLLTVGVLEILHREPGAEITDDSDVYLGLGAGALALGIGMYAWGESAAMSPRSKSSFEYMRLFPTVGAQGGGMTLSTRF